MGELRESKLELAETLSSIGDAVIVVDRSGNVTFLNPVAEKMLGVTLAAALKKPLAEVLHLSDENGAADHDTNSRDFEAGNFLPFQHAQITYFPPRTHHLH